LSNSSSPIETWNHGQAVRELQGTELDLAVAKGACGISAGRNAEHCRLCHQDHTGTLLRDWSVGSTSHRLTMSHH
jgi:hypothetical protein